MLLSSLRARIGSAMKSTDPDNLERGLRAIVGRCYPQAHEVAGLRVTDRVTGAVV